MNALSPGNHLVQPDIALRLPPAPRDRLEFLRREKLEAGASLRVITDDMMKLQQDLAECEVRKRQLLHAPGAGGFGLGPDAPQVQSVQSEIDALRKKRARLRAHEQAVTPRWENASRVLRRCEEFIRDPLVDAIEVNEVEAKPRRKENIVEAVERHRSRLRELAAERHRVSSAPWPSSIAKTMVRDQVKSLADRGRIDVTQVVEHGGDIQFLQASRLIRLDVESDPGANIILEEVDAPALMAWVMGPALLKVLDAEIELIADDAAALTPERRAELLTQIEADMLAAEREECRLIWQAREADLVLAFRDDADPRAVLGVL